jgi:hypothetical protein
MPGNDLAIAIGQNRNNEVEDPDALGDLPELFPVVAAWVGGVRFQFLNPPVGDRQALRPDRPALNPVGRPRPCRCKARVS